MKWILSLFLLVGILCASPPQAVVFDYGKVVATVNRAPLLRFLEKTLSIPYHTLKRDFSRDRLYVALDRPLSFWEEYANCRLNPQWGVDLETKKREMVTPTPGMLPLIRALKNQGLKVVLLSNTDKARSLFLRRLGGYEPFEPVLLSCDLGVRKPRSKIYKILLKKLNLSAHQCLFIDDKKKNIDAAKKAGIDAIVFVSKEKLIKELKKREIEI